MGTRQKKVIPFDEPVVNLKNIFSWKIAASGKKVALKGILDYECYFLRFEYRKL